MKEDDGIYLYKRGREESSNFGYEPYYEAMATKVCEVFCIPHVRYDVVKFRGKLAPKCKLITSEDISMFPVYNFIQGFATEAVSLFLEKYNLLVDYANMHVLDYILLNHDRHFGNYSLLVDSEDFSLIGMSPIYDNGEGCLCNYRERMYSSLEEYTKPREKALDSLSLMEVKDSLNLSNIDIKKLINFKFDRGRLLNCPEKHIRVVESFIGSRVKTLLSI